MQHTNCPICGMELVESGRIAGRDAHAFACRRCGRFGMTRTLLACIPPEAETERHMLPYLSAYTRQSSDRGSPPELTTTNWQDLAGAHATTRSSQKTAKLLDLIASRSRFPGEPVPIGPETDCALIDTGSPEEFSFFLEHLVSRGFLEKHGNGYRVTVAGWQRVETAGAASSGQPGRCFVAMAFDPALNDVYELGIQLAIKDCGFEPIRVDKVEHNEKICDRILAEIRRSRFLVADFTLHRKGVYFEAGFATAIGLPVIFCCRSDELAQTHFDTRQYNHIVWETADDLRAKLSDRVRATIIEKD